MEEKTNIGMELIPVDTRQQMLSVIDYLGNLTSLTVTNAEENERANEVITKLKADAKAFVAKRQELVAPYKEKSTAIEKAIKPVLDAIDNGIRRISDGMVTYHREQEQKRYAEQRKAEAEAEAKRKAEQEKADAERRKAEEYREQGRADLAAKAEVRAETHIEKAVTTVAPTVAPVAKPAGSSYVETWEAKIVDMQKAVPALLAQPTMAQFISIDTKKLEQLQRGFKGTLKIDGIEFVKTYQLRNRT